MSDFLSDEEQLDKLKAWWEQNGLMLVVAVVVAVVGVIGWNWYGDHRAGQLAKASDLYVDLLAAEGVERETIEQTLSAEFPGSSYHVLVLLRNAQQRMSDEDVAGAETLLTEALAQVRDDRLADLIRLRLARVQQQLDRSDDALATLALVTSMGMRAQVHELQGDIHLARGEREQAHEAYSAALAEGAEGAQRPLLEMKVADTADVNEP